MSADQTSIDPKTGLSQQEAEQRLKAFGYNEVPKKR